MKSAELFSQITLNIAASGVASTGYVRENGELTSAVETISQTNSFNIGLFKEHNANFSYYLSYTGQRWLDIALSPAQTETDAV